MRASPLVYTSSGAGNRSRQTLRRRGQVGQGPAERLDDHPAVVADFRRARERLVPVDVAGAGRAAVVLADVDVDEAARRSISMVGPIAFSSMFAWKVSYIVRKCG